MEMLTDSNRDPSWPSWTIDWRSNVKKMHVDLDLSTIHAGQSRRLRGYGNSGTPGLSPRLSKPRPEKSLEAQFQELQRAEKLVLKGVRIGYVGTQAKSTIAEDDQHPLEITYKYCAGLEGFVNRGLYINRTLELELGRPFSDGAGICAPAAAHHGDLVVLLDGATIPFVLRQAENSMYHTFLGACWLWHKSHWANLGQDGDLSILDWLERVKDRQDGDLGILDWIEGVRDHSNMSEASNQRQSSQAFNDLYTRLCRHLGDIPNLSTDAMSDEYDLGEQFVIK